MEDIPQPASYSYSVGDQVQIYIDSDDRDSQYHGVVCEVVDILTDDLDTETGRTIDAYSYDVQDVESGEELPVLFRHRDLIPVEDDQ
jgi:ribosomal protein L21E